jgi:ribosomal protein S14
MRLLSQNRGVGEIRSARDKLIVILETLEFYREQVSPAEQQDIMSLCRLCFRELSVSMSILERAFVDSLEGNKLHKVLKELILRIDNSLMEVKKKNIDLISFGTDDVKRDVNMFYREFVNGMILLSQTSRRRRASGRATTACRSASWSSRCSWPARTKSSRTTRKSSRE